MANKGKMMSTTDDQEIILSVPKSNVFTVVLMGFCLLLGLALPFLIGWQLPVLLCSLFFILVGGGVGPFIVWKVFHDPILRINAEGILSRASFLVKWEEIDSIYSLHARSKMAFAIDISPRGILPFFSRRNMTVPRKMDVTVSQQALVIPSSNLPLPVSELLLLIRERFSAELERYSIDLEDGHREKSHINMLNGKGVQCFFPFSEQKMY